MSFFLHRLNKQPIILALGTGMALLGVFLRFYRITDGDFVFYDEGYYLNYNLHFAEILARNFPSSFSQLIQAVYAFIRVSLATGKALWFILADMRMFFGATDHWLFPRVISAGMGSLSLILTYRFARHFYQSPQVAWLALILLAVLPSHVFYSRIGLQEALSTFLVLAGIYFYVFPARFGIRTFVAGLILGLAFFSNYRLIILPILVAVCELWSGLANRKQPSIRKFAWWLITFLCCVFFIGNINHGQNTVITFAWMFHQGHLAEEHFDAINFLSYPYYLFRLDHGLFALFFFSSLYLLLQRQWRQLLPFILACVQMGIFSLASSKGARYLCVMTPFMAMSAAYAMIWFYHAQKRPWLRRSVILLSLLTVGLMTQKSAAVAVIRSDYKRSVDYLLTKDPQVKFLSTQPYVQNLYVPSRENVKSCPRTFNQLLALYGQGYRYLILGPQAYVSWTVDDKKFEPVLGGFLEFVRTQIPPMETFEHFNDIMLERFVFEHSGNLRRSVNFLNLNENQQYGSLRIYEISGVISAAMQAVQNTKSLRP